MKNKYCYTDLTQIVKTLPIHFLWQEAFVSYQSSPVMRILKLTQVFTQRLRKYLFIGEQLF